MAENFSKNGPLSPHQRAMLRLLAEFDRVCHRLGIPYVLYSGTLLGAVRHRGFIPWDDDLDVMLLRADYARFLAEAPALLDPEIFYLQAEFSPHWPMFFSKLRLENTACLERYHPRDPRHHQGIYLDIFPCDNGLNGRFFQRIQYFPPGSSLRALWPGGVTIPAILSKKRPWASADGCHSGPFGASPPPAGRTAKRFTRFSAAGRRSGGTCSRGVGSPSEPLEHLRAVNTPFPPAGTSC